MACATKTPMGDAVLEAYGRGEDDESLEPLVLADDGGAPVGRIGDGDHVVFYDIRGEREVELTRAFVEPGFRELPTERISVRFTTMIEYRRGLPVEVAFPPIERLGDTLAHLVSAAGLRQARVAESEKAIHVTYFFSGKDERVLPGEARDVVPSPRGSHHDRHPRMSIDAVAERAVARLREPEVALVVANLANVDVVGHIENRSAIISAVEAVDSACGHVVRAARREGVTSLVTADHGTVERWLYPDGKVDTGHTSSPVPFVLVPPAGSSRRPSLRGGGELADVAPTAASLLCLAHPRSWTGRSLMEGPAPRRPSRVLLLILDGWGLGDGGPGDLIAASRTPVMDSLRARYGATALAASGAAVGMPEGSVGNSEVGHLHLGAGRRVPSDRVRIDAALADGTLASNGPLLAAVRGSRDAGRALHLLGIVSFYSSHGSVRHLRAILGIARRERHPKVFVHALLGRRGERPEAGAGYVRDIERECARLGTGRVATVMGRFWALDREGNWDRVAKAYGALVRGEGRAVPPGGASRATGASQRAGEG